MSVFNRVITILLFVVLMIVVPLFLIFPDAMIAFLQQFMSVLSSGLNVFLRVVMVLAGIIFFIVCGLVLYLELRRAAPRRVKLERITGGNVEMAVESIRQGLEYRVDQLPDVISVSSKVKPRRKSIDLELNLETTPDIDVPLKTDEVCEVAREVIEGRMGLELRNIKVNIKHAPYPEVS